MIDRLPGFTLDTGASLRGFGGAAGNVLIDGERPSAKADRLDNILKRIPATSVLQRGFPPASETGYLGYFGDVALPSAEFAAKLLKSLVTPTSS